MKNETRNCVNCGNEFRAYNSTEQFCCKACKYAYIEEQYPGERRECVLCGGVIHAKAPYFAVCKECAPKHKKSDIWVTVCYNCGIEFRATSPSVFYCRDCDEWINI